MGMSAPGELGSGAPCPRKASQIGESGFNGQLNGNSVGDLSRSGDPKKQKSPSLKNRRIPVDDAVEDNGNNKRLRN